MPQERTPSPRTFNWRDYQPAFVRKIGKKGDYAYHKHSVILEECEAIMDRIASRLPPGMDFSKAADPILAYINCGKAVGAINEEEADTAIGFYGPLNSQSVH